MPFITTRFNTNYGTALYHDRPTTYCQHSESASDYGKCYNIIAGRAVFVQTDTTNYPTLPCETDGTCVRYTSTALERTLPTTPGGSSSTIFSYSGKQAILQYFYSRSHSNQYFTRNILRLFALPVPVPDGVNSAYLWFLPATNYELSSWPVYDPTVNYKAYLNPYTITVGYVNILRWQGNVFTSGASLRVYESNVNNIWYAFDLSVVWAYESSPLAIIPLDYDKDYAPYQELRSAFGYASTAIDQPGWNADDIIRVLRDIYPDRAWAVYDDKTYTLYLYNLTPDYVPDWLIDRLTPVAMKVLQSPSNSYIAKHWLDELNQRNAYNQPPAKII